MPETSGGKPETGERGIGLAEDASWFFGNIPVVKKNFEQVVIGIIVVSLLPMVYEISKREEATRREA
ncbi:MAG: hypothetical protein KDN18_14630 [Verrucomicrobiae bacterium]|nr:hypothetical protein [Verrucomicrobiae bacterium]